MADASGSFVRSVLRRLPALPGARVEDVDTPCLLVDMDAFDANEERLLRSMEPFPAVTVRPHAKSHKTPAIALRQIARGRGRIRGVCCQKTIEAEVFAEAGVRDILLSNEVWGASKLRRVAALQARFPELALTVVVDSAANARDLSATAEAQGTRLRCLVELDVGHGRCGARTVEDAVALALVVASLPGLDWQGLHAYHGAAQHVRTTDARRAIVEDVGRRAREAVEALAAAGLACPVVTGGGTGTYRFEAGSGVYTEVQPGSYIFCDADYGRNLTEDGSAAGGREWAFSLFLYSTVMSRSVEDGRVVLDFGLKAASVDSGLPVLVGFPGLVLAKLSDEHAQVEVDRAHPAFRAAEAEGPEALQRWLEVTLPPLGAKVRVIPGHCDPTVNLHDFLVAVRGDVVEDVWEVAARSPGL